MSTALMINKCSNNECHARLSEGLRSEAVFKCEYKNCRATCCRNTRYGAKGMPYDFNTDRTIHFLINPVNAGISVMNWERDALLAEAKKLNINLDIKPLCVSVTDESTIILSWFINHESCPLLNNNFACNAYSVRPLTCRFFPLMPNGVSSECPHAKGLAPEFFADSFTYLKIKNLLVELYSSVISGLANKGVVKKIRTCEVINSLPKKSVMIEEFISKDFSNELKSLINEPSRALAFLRKRSLSIP